MRYDWRKSLLQLRASFEGLALKYPTLQLALSSVKYRRSETSSFRIPNELRRTQVEAGGYLNSMIYYGGGPPESSREYEKLAGSAMKRLFERPGDAYLPACEPTLDRPAQQWNLVLHTLAALDYLPNLDPPAVVSAPSGRVDFNKILIRDLLQQGILRFGDQGLVDKAGPDFPQEYDFISLLPFDACRASAFAIDLLTEPTCQEMLVSVEVDVTLTESQEVIEVPEAPEKDESQEAPQTQETQVEGQIIDVSKIHLTQQEKYIIEVLHTLGAIGPGSLEKVSVIPTAAVIIDKIESHDEKGTRTTLAHLRRMAILGNGKNIGLGPGYFLTPAGEALFRRYFPDLP